MVISQVKNKVQMLKLQETRLESLYAEQLYNVVLNKDNSDRNCLFSNAILTNATHCTHLEDGVSLGILLSWQTKKITERAGKVIGQSSQNS